MGSADHRRAHTISIVVPVYQGETTLDEFVEEIEPLTTPFTTPGGRTAVVQEILFVHDNGPDDSPTVIRRLAAAHAFVRAIWLSRNFGQHPSTLAGMASAGGEWIVTMDEDGQHDPAAMGRMLDTALDAGADVVYARPTNAPPHGAFRNATSRLAKLALRASVGGDSAALFHSYRMVLGEVGRSVAAYAGPGVFLDVALGWVARTTVTCPVAMRAERGRPSGYRVRSLFSHFWRMIITSGTKALRFVSLLGLAFAAAGVVLVVFLVVAQLGWGIDAPKGWASLMVALLLAVGAVLFSLGVIAEYVGVSVNMAMGRPLYVIVSDPANGPLGREYATRDGANEGAPVPPSDGGTESDGGPLPDRA